jgi:hypothetical protein
MTDSASADRSTGFEQQRSRCRARQLEQRRHGVRHLARGLARQAQPLALVVRQPLRGRALQQIRQTDDLADRRAQLVRQLARETLQVAIGLFELGGAYGHHASRAARCASAAGARRASSA